MKSLRGAARRTENCWLARHRSVVRGAVGQQSAAPTCRVFASGRRVVGQLLNCGLSGLTLIFALLVSACVTVDERPASWPSRSEPNLIGKCANIAGRYQNTGSSAPASAKPILLSELLLLEAGDEVVITQTPDKIIATSIRADVAVSMATYGSSLVSVAGILEGWDTRKPMAFACLLDVLTGRRDVSFNHQRTDSKITGLGGGAGAVVVTESAAVRYSKAEDDSLLVGFMKSSAAILIMIPVGVTEEVWYRYPVSRQP